MIENFNNRRNLFFDCFLGSVSHLGFKLGLFTFVRAVSVLQIVTALFLLAIVRIEVIDVFHVMNFVVVIISFY